MSKKTDKPVSRQRRWQLAKSSHGCCEKCGNKLGSYKTLCDGCAEKHRADMRRSRGLRPWRPGGPGRPPLGYKPPEKETVNGEAN